MVTKMPLVVLLFPFSVKLFLPSVTKDKVEYQKSRIASTMPCLVLNNHERGPSAVATLGSCKFGAVTAEP